MTEAGLREPQLIAFFGRWPEPRAHPAASEYYRANDMRPTHITRPEFSISESAAFPTIGESCRKSGMSKQPTSSGEAAEYLEKEIEKTLESARHANLGALALILEQALNEARALRHPRPS